MIRLRLLSPSMCLAFVVWISLLVLPSDSSLAACGVPQAESKTELSKTQGDSTLSFSQQLQGYFQTAKDAGATSASTAGHWLAELYDNASKNTSETTSSAMKWLTQQYDNAVSAGDTTAKSAQAWLSDDLGKIGTWEYRLKTVVSAKGFEEELNKMGSDRWECFSVVSHGDRLIYHFKRQHRSYLQTLPAKELLRLAPLLDFREE